MDADELDRLTVDRKQMHMAKLRSQPATQEVSEHRRQQRRVSAASGDGKKPFKRRHSLQVGTNWLQEYSQFNMTALQNRIVQTHKSNAAETASRAYSVLSPSSATKEHSYNTMAGMFQEREQMFAQTQRFDFDIFQFAA